MRTSLFEIGSVFGRTPQPPGPVVRVEVVDVRF
jgi:hypothetical protein